VNSNLKKYFDEIFVIRDCRNVINTGVNEMSRLKDLRGEHFTRLGVLRRMDENAMNGNARWLCRCECGNLTVADGTQLRSGTKKSCGCLRRDLSKTVFMSNDKITSHIGRFDQLVNEDGIPYSSLVRNRRNHTGVIGVSYDKKSEKWFARLMHNHHYVLLKSFDTIEEAVEARKLAEAKYFKHDKACTETEQVH
jgi:hypothetical protein